MLRRLLATPDDRVMFLIRLVAGIVILPHGLQKVFGMFGGPGISGFVGYMGSSGIPAVLAYLAIAAEFLGGLGLIVGLLGRVAAFGVFMNMLVATLMVHAKVGFFMNWSGQQQGEGYEYHLLMMAMTLAVMIRGSGAWSADRILAGRPDGRS